MNHAARIHLHSHTTHRDLVFDHVWLRCGAPWRWDAAEWVFQGAEGEIAFRTTILAEVTAQSGPFPVGFRIGAPSLEVLEVTGVLSGEPQGAHCLLYTPRGDGFWRGHTLATHVGRPILRRYDYDPG